MAKPTNFKLVQRGITPLASMRVPRGTARRLRRREAMHVAATFKISGKDFSKFWRLGGDSGAATIVKRERLEAARAFKNEGADHAAHN